MITCYSIDRSNTGMLRFAKWLVTTGGEHRQVGVTITMLSFGETLEENTDKIDLVFYIKRCTSTRGRLPKTPQVVF